MGKLLNKCFDCADDLTDFINKKHMHPSHIQAITTSTEDKWILFYWEWSL